MYVAWHARFDGQAVWIRGAWSQLKNESSTSVIEMCQFWWTHLVEVAWPLLIGCTVVGVCLAILFYFLSLHLIRFYRKRQERLTTV